MRNYILVVAVLFSVTAQGQLYKTSIAGGFSITNSYRYFANRTGDQNATATIDLRNMTEHQLITYGAWADVDYYFKKRVFINGGLRFARLGYSSDLSILLSSSSAPSPAIDIQLRDLYFVFSMPLAIGYSFISKPHINMYVAGGIGPDLMLKHYISRRTDFKNNDVKREHIADPTFAPKKINLSYTVKFGFLSQLSGNDGLKFNLLYYTNIGYFNTNPVGLKLTSVSLDIGYVRGF